MAQCITIAVTSNRNVFLPPCRSTVYPYHNAVHYNCGNKQHKRIHAAVQTGCRSKSQRSALQLHYQATQTYSSRSTEWQQIYITAQCIAIAVTSNANVIRPQYRMAADQYHNAVHYNCSNEQHKRISADVQTSSTTISKRSSLQLR